MPSQAQIKKIHALKGALKMDDDIYRLLLSAYGVKSSTKLSLSRADELIRNLEDKATSAGVWEKRKPARPAKAKKLADDPQSKKIRALWIELHQAGKVNNSAESALLAYIKRMTGRDALQWLNTRQASTVIEALKQWLER